MMNLEIVFVRSSRRSISIRLVGEVLFCYVVNMCTSHCEVLRLNVLESLHFQLLSVVSFCNVFSVSLFDIRGILISYLFFCAGYFH